MYIREGLRSNDEKKSLSTAPSCPQRLIFILCITVFALFRVALHCFALLRIASHWTYTVMEGAGGVAPGYVLVLVHVCT